MSFSIFATSQNWTDAHILAITRPYPHRLNVKMLLVIQLASCNSEEMIPMMHSTFLNIAAKMPEADAEQLQATCLASCFAPGINFMSGRGSVR
jgi:hypothetical protein